MLSADGLISKFAGLVSKFAGLVSKFAGLVDAVCADLVAERQPRVSFLIEQITEDLCADANIGFAGDLVDQLWHCKCRYLEACRAAYPSCTI